MAPEVISRQLLGIDQRTFPFVCDWRGIWGTPAVVPFLDIIWEPPFLLIAKPAAVPNGIIIRWNTIPNARTGIRILCIPGLTRRMWNAMQNSAVIRG